MPPPPFPGDDTPPLQDPPTPIPVPPGDDVPPLQV
jgi:hypothetical protein